MKKVAIVVGGRPNYIKLAPVVRALDATDGIKCLLIDAGQHYSPEMRSRFFDEVGLRKYDVWFDIGAGTHAEHTSSAMCKMETWLGETKPDMVIVHGDMDYAVGCALATAKAHIPLIHNEAGLRSFDRGMPEEINRVLIDHMATHHFVTEGDAIENLLDEGINSAVMIGSTLADSIQYIFGVMPQWELLEDAEEYAVLTMHRPENVDDPTTLKARMETIVDLSEIIKVKMVCHPRLQGKMMSFTDKIECCEALGYKAMLDLMLGSSIVVTDSGGLQEETTILGIPCLTWRKNTERPITVDIGTNRLTTGHICEEVEHMLGHIKVGMVPRHWDGHASSRIADWVGKQ